MQKIWQKIFALQLLMLLAFGADCHAQIKVNPELAIYSVTNVKVALKNTDAATGKTQALAQAKKLAFAELANRFISYGYINKPINPSTEQIEESLSEFELIEELIIGQKYEARYNFEFIPQKTLELLSLKADGNNAIRESYLLIPVLIEKGKTSIWTSDWFAAWKNFKAENITIPLGDMDDIKTTNGEEIAKLNYTGIDALARRYKKPVIVLVEAEYSVRENKLKINLKRFEHKPSQLGSYEYSGAYGTGSANLFATAAQDLFNKIKAEGVARDGAAIENSTKNSEFEIEYIRDYQSDKRSQQKTIKTKVMTRSLSDWSVIRRKMMNSKIINDIVANVFADDGTTVNLYYNGEFEELERSLNMSGLSITANAENKEEFIIDRLQ